MRFLGRFSWDSEGGATLNNNWARDAFFVVLQRHTFEQQLVDSGNWGEKASRTLWPSWPRSPAVACAPPTRRARRPSRAPPPRCRCSRWWSGSCRSPWCRRRPLPRRACHPCSPSWYAALLAASFQQPVNPAQLLSLLRISHLMRKKKMENALRRDTCSQIQMIGVFSENSAFCNVSSGGCHFTPDPLEFKLTSHASHKAT